ncbi:hypothetical protein AMCSP13_002489 [Streptococcus pneumoniae 2070335]|nr:hypothetical protein SPAR33_2349 [Streptococcus pneumoniae GA13723]EJG41876.1 hypothetical protein AMCSP13_002489 [Streptococcus pneumoniae 2070335]
MEHLVVLSFIFSKFLECGILRKRLNSDKNWRNSTKNLKKRR